MWLRGTGGDADDREGKDTSRLGKAFRGVLPRSYRSCLADARWCFMRDTGKDLCLHFLFHKYPTGVGHWFRHWFKKPMDWGGVKPPAPVGWAYAGSAIRPSHIFLKAGRD